VNFYGMNGRNRIGLRAGQVKQRAPLSKRKLRVYLSAGGFPEAQRASARDRFDLLRGYVDAMLLRDVIERHAVSHPVALRWMARQLVGNAGGNLQRQQVFK
jgi:hypothetical protein